MALFQPTGGGGGVTSYSQTQRDALTPTTGQVIFNTTSGRVEQYDGSVWNYCGWPVNIGYIKNSGAETSATTGWATFADAAQSTPTDGTGGSPNVTWTSSSTSPLRDINSFIFTKDAANRQGQGVSYDFSIATADQGRVLSINFDYYISSGTYASNDMSVWVYDVTNAVLLPQPSGNSIISTSIPSQQGQCTFQTSINSTSYRLIFFVGSTSASAYTVKFDNIQVGPQIGANGSIDTAWTAFTPTGSWSTNTTYTGFWRRNGDSLDLDIKVAVAGAPTSASLTVNLPSGFVIDTTKITDTGAGIASWNSFVSIRDAGTDVFEGFAAYNSTTSVAILKDDGDGTLSAVTQAAPMTWANGDYASIQISGIPISGWASSNILSTSGNTKAVVFTGTQSSQSLTADVTNVSFTAVKDSVAGWSTNIYTVAVPGDYLVSVSVFSNGTSTPQVYKNGSVFGSITTIDSASRAGAGSLLLPNLVVGDTISLRSATSVTYSSGNMSIVLQQSPQQIAASEIIAFFANTSNTAAGTSTRFVFTNKVFDTHNAYSTSTGIYTVPAPGYYFFTGAMSSSSGTAFLTLYKNGSLLLYGSTGSTTEVGNIAGPPILLAAGDTIDLRPSGSQTAVNSATQCLFGGYRLGGVS